MKIQSGKDLKDFIKNSGEEFVAFHLSPTKFFGFESIDPDYQVFTLRSQKDIYAGIDVVALEDIAPEEIDKLPKRNSTSLMQSPAIYDLLKKKKNLNILYYTGRKKFIKFCEENNWIPHVPNYEVSKKFLENKIIFKKIAQEASINVPASEIFSVDKIDEILKRYSKKIVVQTPDSAGGKGTFFVETQEDIDKIKVKLTEEYFEVRKTTEVKVSEFIEGRSASVIGVATRWGTFTGRIQTQLIDVPEITKRDGTEGCYNGHDWSLANKIFDEKTHVEAIALTQKFGDHIYKMGYRGIFGIDIMIEDSTNKVYAIECNARLSGAFPAIDLLLGSQDRITFKALQAMEFMANKYDFEVNFEQLQKEISAPNHGSQFVIYAPHVEEKETQLNMKNGRYSIDPEIVYLDNDYKNFTDNSFTLMNVSGVPKTVNTKKQICKVITTASVADDFNSLNNLGLKIVDTILNNYKGA